MLTLAQNISEAFADLTRRVSGLADRSHDLERKLLEEIDALRAEVRDQRLEIQRLQLTVAELQEGIQR